MELVFIFICKYMRTFLDNVGEVRTGGQQPIRGAGNMCA
jgi:hypothetical protein